MGFSFGIGIKLHIDSIKLKFGSYKVKHGGLAWVVNYKEGGEPTYET